jgi:hypothetical protein
MSLKAFHLVFITAAIALALLCGVWAFQDYAGADGGKADLWSGVAALAVSVGLLCYERYFLKRTKNVSYL